MLEISKIDYNIFKIPTPFGKHLALENLKTKLTDAIQLDISFIVENGLPKSLSDIDKPLIKLFGEIGTLPDSKQKEEIFQQLRFLILVLDNRLKGCSHEDAGVLGKTLATITKTVGVVPVLNPNVPLPDEEFLPQNYITQTVKRWSKIDWTDPGRYVKEERLSFLENTKIHTSSVRAHLLALERKSEHPDFFLSYADVDFYHYGNLQADHLQPSEQIVARQKELISAMNIDPTFKKQMIESPYNKDYFITTDEEGTIAGSKKFYMEYHNCVGNLWMITPAENTGQGKGDADPINWLNSHPSFGKPFFASFGGREVLTDTILYRAPDGALLAEYTKRWFQDYYKAEIAATDFVSFQVKAPMKDQVAAVADSRKRGRSWKRKSMRLQAKHGIASVLGQESSPSPTFFAADDSDRSIHSSDIDSDEAAITEGTLRRSKRLAIEQKSALDKMSSDVASRIVASITPKL